MHCADLVFNEALQDWEDVVVLEADLHPSEEINWLEPQLDEPFIDCIEQAREDEWDYLRSTGYPRW